MPTIRRKKMIISKSEVSHLYNFFRDIFSKPVPHARPALIRPAEKKPVEKKNKKKVTSHENGEGT
jgi:hypothetical protein